MTKKIGLLGLYASRNLGDTAIQRAVIDNLSARIPAAQFIGICPDPEDTRQTFGIDCVDLAGRPLTATGAQSGGSPLAAVIPWRVRTAAKRLATAASIRRCLMGLDLLVLSGGGQLDEFWGGPWEHPWRLFLWTQLARRRRVPVASLGLGMDVLQSRPGRWLSVSAMRAASVRTFRDTGTAAAIEGFGLRASFTVIPDLAFSLMLPAARAAPAASAAKFVAVSAISERALVSDVASAHDGYISSLAAACLDWMARGLKVRFVCSQPQMDLPVIERIVALLPAAGGGADWEIAQTSTVASYVDAVRGAEFVVASRLHGLILALLAETPVVAVVGNRKVQQLMNDVGLTEYTVPLASLTSTALRDVAARIGERRAALAASIVAYNTQARQALAAVYDRVAGLLTQT
jgi:polysaccharide pyruvyl transferase WcaK-like protein